MRPAFYYLHKNYLENGIERDTMLASETIRKLCGNVNGGIREGFDLLIELKRSVFQDVSIYQLTPILLARFPCEKWSGQFQLQPL